jgi:beta-lactamase regulating signal transducer with metallopeptidase domain
VLVDSAVKGAVILAVAWGATLLMRRASAAMRHLVWGLSVVSLMILPGLSVVLPAWRVLPGWAGEEKKEIVSVKAAEAVVIPERVNVEPPRSQVEAVAPHGEVKAMVEPSPAKGQATGTVQTISGPEKVWAIGLLGWICGCALVLARVIVGNCMLWRMGQKAEKLNGEYWNEVLGRLMGELGGSRWVMLLRGGEKSMPMTWGIIRPRVLLPSEAEQWSPARRRMVFGSYWRS